MAVKPSEGKLLYHLTSLANIASIVELGLCPRAYLDDSQFKDVADPEIIEKRARFSKASLDEFVPFHFFVRNPFDGAVCAAHGSENFAIIALLRDAYRDIGIVIPSHPLNSQELRMYPYEEGIKKIDWEILDDLEHRDYHDWSVRQACMAECLIPEAIPVDDFAFLYVVDEKAKMIVLGAGYPGTVTIAPYMFPGY